MRTLERRTPGTFPSVKFPIGRALIALVVVPLFTTAVFWCAVLVTEPTSFESLTTLIVVSAWPGAVIFLLLGLPTLYLLFRLRRLHLLVFLFFGAFYTGAPWIYIEHDSRGHRGGYILFALIGIVNGWITRLIVFGHQ